VSTFLAAGTLEPAVLRSLEALQLAATLELGDDLEGLVTYDARFGATGSSGAILVVAPAPS